MVSPTKQSKTKHLKNEVGKKNTNLTVVSVSFPEQVKQRMSLFS